MSPVVHSRAHSAVAGCPAGSSPTTQSVPQTFNAGNGTIPAGDCMWFNNKLVPTSSICQEVTNTGKPVVIQASAQTVREDYVNSPVKARVQQF